MWDQDDENHITDRECAVCVKRLTCTILDPLIQYNGFVYQPDEWNKPIVGNPFCQELCGDEKLLLKRFKREERLAKGKELKRQNKIARQQEIHDAMQDTRKSVEGE